MNYIGASPDVSNYSPKHPLFYSDVNIGESLRLKITPVYPPPLNVFNIHPSVLNQFH